MVLFAGSLAAGAALCTRAADREGGPSAASADAPLQNPVDGAAAPAPGPLPGELLGPEHAVPGQHPFVIPRGICESREPVQSFPGRGGEATGTAPRPPERATGERER